MAHGCSGLGRPWWVLYPSILRPLLMYPHRTNRSISAFSPSQSRGTNPARLQLDCNLVRHAFMHCSDLTPPPSSQYGGDRHTIFTGVHSNMFVRVRSGSTVSKRQPFLRNSIAFDSNVMLSKRHRNMMGTRLFLHLPQHGNGHLCAWALGLGSARFRFFRINYASNSMIVSVS